MTIDRPPATHTLRTQRARRLSGMVVVGGDPQIAMRALVAGTLVAGETHLRALPLAGEVAAVAEALAALGARLEAFEDHHVLSGLGPGGLLEPRGPLLLFGAEAAAPLLLGAAGIHPFLTRIVPAVTMAPEVGAVLDALGCSRQEDADGTLVEGPRIGVPGSCPAPTTAAAEALLLAALSIPGRTTAVGVPPGPDHLLAALAAYGAALTVTEDEQGRRIAIDGLPALRPLDAFIPGEPTEAAMWLIAASIVGGSEVIAENVLLNPWRAGLVQVLLDMGADLMVVRQEQALGEDVAAIRARQAPLTGTVIDRTLTASAGEALPFLVLAAAFATGDTVFEGFAGMTDEHRWKEAMMRGLTANGVQWEADADRLVVHGQGRVTGGGLIPAHRDPRIPLMFLMMGMSTRDPITVIDESPIAARYPGALETLRRLGAAFKREG
jgi:3-phosphoshikimate 1-carboxyvinyltransferase